MRCRSILHPLAAVCVTACNRDVTAPRALEIADAAEQQLSQNWNSAVLGQLYSAENFFNIGWPNPDSTTIWLSKDGATDQLTATVIERVYVPPKGEGMPISRRSLVAWRHDANYGLVAVTETHADESGRFGEHGFDSDFLNPRPWFVAPSAQKEDWWLGRIGKVRIEPQKTGDTCPFGNGGDTEEERSGRVTCNVATYVVELEGELLRQHDIDNGLLPEALKPRHHITVTTQRVNGIRFTVRCHPADLVTGTQIYLGCTESPLRFWRSNELFTASLGVDVKQMKRLGDRLNPLPVYGRTLIQGNEKSPGGSRLVRYTESYPDGTVIERGSADVALNLPADETWLEQCARGMGYGGRRQCLVVPFGHPKMQSRYGVFVVDMEEVARP